MPDRGRSADTHPVAGRAIDVTALINGAPLSAYQVQMMVLCGAVAMIDGFDAQSIGFVAPVIAQLWDNPASALGPILSAGLVGLMLGALILGPAADRFGRKPIIIFSTIVMGVFSCLTAHADSLGTLFAYRFLTGVGLGGALPNITALASEFSPDRLRATVVTFVLCGFPLGAVVGGYISALMIPVYGWESVFYLGGVSPPLLTLVLLARLPESIRFLVQTGRSAERVRHALSRIIRADMTAAGDRFAVPEVQITGTVKHLFGDGRFSSTILLWTAFFMNLLMVYFVVNWLPYLARLAGLPVKTAILLAVIFNVGGVIGSILLGRLIDSFGACQVLSLTYVAAALLVAAIGFSDQIPQALTTIVFAAGFCVIGAQIGIYALATVVYPTAIRSTGVGWAVGVGRIGSIVGPLMGGALLAAQWSFTALFVIVSVPALVAGSAVFKLGSRRDGATQVQLG